MRNPEFSYIENSGFLFWFNLFIFFATPKENETKERAACQLEDPLCIWSLFTSQTHANYFALRQECSWARSSCKCPDRNRVFYAGLGQPLNSIFNFNTILVKWEGGKSLCDRRKFDFLGLLDPVDQGIFCIPSSLVRLRLMNLLCRFRGSLVQCIVIHCSLKSLGHSAIDKCFSIREHFSEQKIDKLVS